MKTFSKSFTLKIWDIPRELPYRDSPKQPYIPEIIELTGRVIEPEDQSLFVRLDELDRSDYVDRPVPFVINVSS